MKKNISPNRYMRALFVSPYLETLGGGEKYLLDIARTVHELGYETSFAWKDKSIKDKIIERYGKNYEFITIDTSWHKKNTISRTLYTKSFDLIFYHPDGSYFFSLARRNFALLQVPSVMLAGSKSFINQLKLRSWTPVFNSHFTKRHFLKVINPEAYFVLYPTISNEFFTSFKKEKIILSVGRFFAHLHSKKQEILIKAFQQACEKYPEFSSYRLILAGSYHKEDAFYVEKLVKIASADPRIEIRTNCHFNDLLRFYHQAMFYWHAAGYRQDYKTHPERVEHFGISIVEAMAAGAVPFSYNAGGPKETIEDGLSGYLYSTKTELIKKTYSLMQNIALIEKMRERAKNRALAKFGFAAFKKRVFELIQ